MKTCRNHFFDLFLRFNWSGGLSTSGVLLDSSAKSSIFSAETTLEATDSYPHPLQQIEVY
jgi:hypothetical protein